MTKGLFDKEIWALSADAEAFVNEMVVKGMDRDLAISFLEIVVGEEMYSLPIDEIYE